MGSREFWIGVCVGIPLLIALFMKDDDFDAFNRRTTDKSDEHCGLPFPHGAHPWFDGDHDHGPDRNCPGGET